MRILHVLNDVEAFGNGIVHVAVDTSCLQAEDGHDVSVASAGGAYVDLLQSHGVRHYECVATPRSRTPRALFELARCVTDFRPEVVHCHMVTSLLISQPARLRRPRVRLVSTVHNSFSRSAVLMGLSDRVIAVSQAVASDMASRGIDERKIDVIANGPLASPRKIAPPPRQQRSQSRIIVTTVAGMYERKGISDLLTAFDMVSGRFPEAVLTVVGEGPDRSRFQSMADTLSSRDRIKFVGFVADPTPYLSEADVFVLASRADPSPLVIPEARSASCAVIGTRVDGIPEALDQGEAGLLVEPSQPAAIAASLERLLSDRRLLAEMQQRAASNLDRFKAERVARETVGVYEAALGGARH